MMVQIGLAIVGAFGITKLYQREQARRATEIVNQAIVQERMRQIAMTLQATGYKYDSITWDSEANRVIVVGVNGQIRRFPLTEKQQTEIAERLELDPVKGNRF